MIEYQYFTGSPSCPVALGLTALLPTASAPPPRYESGSGEPAASERRCRGPGPPQGSHVSMWRSQLFGSLGASMLSRAVLVITVFMCAAAPGAPAQVHLSGVFDVGVQSGILKGHACLTDRPAQRRATLILNAGLNVRAIHSGDGRARRYLLRDDNVRAATVGEALVYTLRDTLAPSDSLCIDYVGMFPVYDGVGRNFAAADYKGFIAFNGRTVRAAEQSKWYPMLYDSTLGPRAHEAVRYRATVVCADCESVYMNGDTPKAGPSAAFASSEPVSMLLFAGSYNWQAFDGSFFLNATLSDGDMATIVSVVDSVKHYLAGFVGVPYGQPIVFINHSIIENNQRRQWGFVTYPTIAFSNDGLKLFVNDTTGRATDFTWGYLGHEMAHYYFGTLLHPAGPLGSLMESMAEYHALTVVRHFQGDSAFHERLAPYVRRLRGDTAGVRLDAIRDAAQVTDAYWYELVPAMLVGLEAIVGAPAMRAFIGTLVRRRDSDWNYDLLRAAALESGISAEAWSRFEQRCVVEHRSACVQ